MITLTLDKDTIQILNNHILDKLLGKLYLRGRSCHCKECCTVRNIMRVEWYRRMAKGIIHEPLPGFLQ